MNDIRRVLSYDDVSLPPRHSALKSSKCGEVKMTYSGIPFEFSAVPIFSSPMDTVCSREMIAKMIELECVVTIHRLFPDAAAQMKFLRECHIDWMHHRVFVAVGGVTKWKDWIDYVIDVSRDQNFGILVDMANGDTLECVETVQYIRKCHSGINIMAGNVATKSGYMRLADVGANFIRVGIGGGSICSTRLRTGFGIPTLTSVIDCAKVSPSGVYLIADGGIEKPGDACKAMAAGAHGVMCGKLLASTSLAAGEKYDTHMELVEDLTQCRWVEYYGMASQKVREIMYPGSRGSIEGVEGVVRYTGKTEDVVEDFITNMRCSMTYYGGCTTWDEFRRRIKMVELTSVGLEESRTRVREVDV